MHIAMLGVKGLPHPSGIENVVEQIGSRLVAKGHQVTVYVRPHYTPRAQSCYKGMRLVHLPSIRTKCLDAITHTLLATLHVMRTGADIAHFHSIGMSVFSALPRLQNIKTVVQSHGLDWQRSKWGPIAQTYLKATDYTTVFLPDVATVVSRKLQSYYAARFHRAVTYIPNGVSCCPAVPAQEITRLGLKGNDYILFAARLVPEKGCHYLVDAYKRLPEPRKKLVIAGDSNYGDAYAAQLKRQQTPDIQFLGFVRGRLLQELMSHAYVYVLPSEIEGLSTGLMEAMSYGNCVVVSDIEENLEVIQQSGCSFRSKNVADLARTLEQLLANGPAVEAYRTRARERVCDFYNWDTVTDQYEALYRSLLRH